MSDPLITMARVCIVSASGQNIFFAELLDALESTLTAVGLEVERSVDRFPPWRDDVVYLLVPHEYMPLVEEKAHPDEMHLRRTIVLCTEQPGTTWFEEAAAVARRAAAVVDINRLGTRELSRRGIDASLMRLGYVADWDTWGGRMKGSGRWTWYSWVATLLAERARWPGVHLGWWVGVQSCCSLRVAARIRRSRLIFMPGRAGGLCCAVPS